jgi:hypothetical protein
MVAWKWISGRLISMFFCAHRGTEVRFGDRFSKWPPFQRSKLCPCASVCPSSYEILTHHYQKLPASLRPFLTVWAGGAVSGGWIF